MGGRQSIVIYPGERYIYKKRDGTFLEPAVSTVVRPKSDEDCYRLNSLAANQLQYLVISKTDGEVIHKRGPVVEFWDPRSSLVDNIRSVEVRNCESLGQSEVLVVYRNRGLAGKKKKKEEEPNETERLIVAGPTDFFPEANDRIHHFEWHGTDPENKTRKIPGALKFYKLKVSPDQMYFNVTDVRTSDDALITVKLMVFFELAKLELMLDTTHDPIADFINSVTADIISFAASMPYEIFVEKTSALNDLDTYQNLTSRAKGIGYKITKVVYRGYHASDKLQSMHDHAIQARTQLRLESETEEQAQKLADLKLMKESERAQRKQQMQQAEIDHQNKLSRKEHEEKLHQRRTEIEAELQAKRAENQEQLSYLDNLHKLGVDLTSYLVAQHAHPDRIIEVRGESAGNIHLHDKNKKK